MYLTVPILALVSSLYLCACHPASTLQPLTLNPSLPPDTNTLPQNVTNTLPTNVSYPGTTFIPIPNTPFTMRVAFGIRRHRMSQFDIGGILAQANDTLNQGIETWGADSIYQVFNERHTQQRFWQFEPGPGSPSLVLVSTVREGRARFFTWGEIRDVVEALFQFLIVGTRHWQALFRVLLGGETGRVIGSGRIRDRPE